LQHRSCFAFRFDDEGEEFVSLAHIYSQSSLLLRACSLSICFANLTSAAAEWFSKIVQTPFLGLFVESKLFNSILVGLHITAPLWMCCVKIAAFITGVNQRNHLQTVSFYL